jgi:hypothetical protein
MELVQALGDSGEIVLEPVGHQHGLAVCRLNQILQRIQFAVMNMDYAADIVIDCAVGHLESLFDKAAALATVISPSGSCSTRSSFRSS